MLKFKVLVCDDEKDKYDRLIEMLGQELFEYEYLNSIYDLEGLKELEKYDVLFLDLYFKRNLPVANESHQIISFEQLKEIRTKLTKKKKLIIYTMHTSDEIALLRKAALEGIIDEWIDAQDLYEDGSKKEETIIRINKVIGVHNRSQSSLCLYHFSDIHYGKQYKYLKKEICNFLVEQVRDQAELIRSKDTKLDLELPKLLAFSGDFTHHATDEEFQNALKFVKDVSEMLEEYGISSPIITLCTGNHDFNWDDSISQEHTTIKIDDKVSLTERTEPSDKYIKSIKWNRFNQIFFDQIAKYSTISNYPEWIYYNYADRFGLKIFSINTAYNMTYKNNKVFVDRKTLEELYEIVRKEKPCYGILLCHHPLHDWGDEKAIEEIKHFLFEKLKIRVILSGHRHSNTIISHRIESNRNIHEIRTGSLSVSDSERDHSEPPAFRILKFEKNNENSWERIRSFTFEYRDGKYRPRPDKRGEYEEIVNI